MESTIGQERGIHPTSSTVIRLSGVAAIGSGLSWIAGAIATARLPEGCVAAACLQPGRSMRESTATAGGLIIAAIVLLVASAIGLLIHARAQRRLGTSGQFGLLASAAGLTTIALCGVMAALLFDGDFPLMPLFIIPAGLVTIAGLLVAGVSVLRAGLLPTWAGAVLILGTLAMLGFNDQDARVLLAVPFGLALIAVGTTMWSARAT